jgi:hypothetical protein
VRANKGAAGIDGLGIDETAKRLIGEWPVICEQLLRGTYRPEPVRRVTIPKPDGGQRKLGIPTVTDRLIQQALLQVLQPLLDPTFSQHSYGFRPGRSLVRIWQAMSRWFPAFWGKTLCSWPSERRGAQRVPHPFKTRSMHPALVRLRCGFKLCANFW